MRNLHVLCIAAAALLAPLFACAAGSESALIDLGGISAQSETNDGGNATGQDSGLASSTGATSEDSGSSSLASNDAGAPASEDAGSQGTGVDASTPPPSEDSGSVMPPPSEDSGSGSLSCPGYAPPNTPSQCNCDSSEHACTPNGCYNGYYCKLSGYKCEAPPSGC
jgi:hypothetical protein